jgi:hypothetical protein
VIVLLLVMLPPYLVQAQGPEPVKIRVEVTDSGFNGQAGDFSLEVEQGALVEITFVWAHQAQLDEEHIIVLEGYNVETDKINRKNRESTVKFIADKPGAFGFRCDVECHVHDYLQRGQLKVVARGGSGQSAAYTPTTLTVTPSSWATGGDVVNLTAVLKDATGAPVSKAEIRFTVEAEFAGTKGAMGIGRSKTDANGVAFFDYEPLLSARKHKITAHFDRMGIYDQSEKTIEIEELGVPPSAYTEAPLGLEGIRQWAPMALIAVIAAIWAIFGFVLYQVVVIFRVGTKQ